METLYPYATQRLLKPEIYNEPIIIPRQLMFHTHGFSGSSSAVGNFFDNMTDVESHASVALDGRFWQFMPFNRQADAQAFANGFKLANAPGKLFGAISLEHEEDGTRRFSQAQIITDGLFGAWAHTHLGIPVGIVSDIKAPGWSWHRKDAANNPNRHGCPYDGQIAQIPEIMNVANWFLSQARRNGLDIVGRLETLDGSRWALQRDGGVITEAGDKFYGSYLGLPVHARLGDRWFKAIEMRDDGQPGYVLVSNHNERYTFPYTG